MRKTLVVSIGWLCVVACLPTSARSEDVRITCYDDGISCPAGCDAHVVVHPSMNGTAHVHRPGTGEADPQKCASGNSCEICFSRFGTECTTATYRGSGPPPGRFDFTPRYFESVCPQPGLPRQLSDHCAALNRAAERWAKRLDCFQNAEHSACAEVMRAAKAAKDADAPLYGECKRLGEAAFNRKYADRRELQRSNECAYEKHGTGKNSKGQTWRRLLPAACREGSFVGRDGLDCCTDSVFSAACFDRECAAFFPRHP